MDGESDEEGLSSEAHGAAIIEALGWERRNEVRSWLQTAHEMCLTFIKSSLKISPTF